MKDNILISGWIEEENEDPKEIVSEFFGEKMSLEFPHKHIHVAHWMGKAMEDRPMLMAAKLHPELKQLVIANKKNLKGKKNIKEWFYSVKTQLPDVWEKQRRELRETMRKAHKVNDKKLESQEKDKTEIENHTLYVNKAPQKNCWHPHRFKTSFQIRWNKNR